MQSTCCLIFWKQSNTGTLGMLWILLRESRHTGNSWCLRAILAYWMMALAEWCTINIAWLLCACMRGNSICELDTRKLFPEACMWALHSNKGEQKLRKLELARWPLS